MEVKDFLNPKSMLTPGACGGITMLVSGALANNFSLQPKWTGLVLSLLLSLLVISLADVPTLWQRVVYWLLNGLAGSHSGSPVNSSRLAPVIRHFQGFTMR